MSHSAFYEFAINPDIDDEIYFVVNSCYERVPDSSIDFNKLSILLDAADMLRRDNLIIKLAGLE